MLCLTNLFSGDCRPQGLGLLDLLLLPLRKLSRWDASHLLKELETEAS